MVAFLTGSRAEYGLLEQLFWLVPDSQWLVTGSHLSPAHGLTVDEIDGPIAGRIECVLSSDTRVGMCRSFSLAVSSFAEHLDRLRPDAVVILGDRYEMLAGAIAAHVCRISIVHIHGGESSIGSLDNAFRHSISHMARLHFPATEQSADRLRQFGLTDIHCLGALGCDGLEKQKWDWDGTIIVLFHPATKANENYKNIQE